MQPDTATGNSAVTVMLLVFSRASVFFRFSEVNILLVRGYMPHWFRHFRRTLRIPCMWTDGFCKQSNMRFHRGAGQSDTSGIFLIGAAHTAMKGGCLLSETGRDVSARIVSFSPVKRDTKKCTTGTTRHVWIRIAHFYTICCFLQRLDKRGLKKHSPKLDYNCLILWIDACFLRKSKKHAKFAINSLNTQH